MVTPLRLRPLVLLAFAAAVLSCDEGTGIVEQQPELVVDPGSLDFGNIQVGTTATRVVFLRNTGDGNLTLAAVSMGAPFDPAFSFQVEGDKTVVVPGGVAALNVVFAPTAEGLVLARIAVRPADDSVPAQEIGVQGTGVSTSLTVEPEVVNFGNVILNTTKTMSVQLSNASDVDADIEYQPGVNLKSCGSGISDPSTFCLRLRDREIGPDSHFVLRAQESTQAQLEFKPVVLGSTERGSFELRACENPACVHEIKLIGVGVEQGFRCTPTALDFGPINPGACVTRSVRCENIANETVTMLGWGPQAGPSGPTSPEFMIEAASVVVLSSGESDDIDVRYCPTNLGLDEGNLAVETDNRDPRFKFVYVPIRGTGGGPNIDVIPMQLNFGLVSLIAPSRRTLLITNNGQDALDVSEIVADTDGTGAFRVTSTTGGVVQPGGSFEVSVEFQPMTAGPVESHLLVRSNDADQPELSVRVFGDGINLPPCSFEITPAQLSFGVVERGRVASRAFEIRNLGTDNCLLTAARLQPGSATEFSLPDGDVSSELIPAGGSATIRAQYAPTTASMHQGGVEFSISSPTSPFNTVPLNGTGANSALLVVPNDLDFGTIGVGCGARARTVTLYNTGAASAVIDSIALAAPDSGAFTITALPPPLPGAPLTIPAGGNATFDVGFRAAQISSYAGAVEITGTFSGQPVTYVVSLFGRGDLDATQTDHFEQLGKPKVDILFVIDNSGSMLEEQTALAANFTTFIQFAEAQALEYQIAVTTTDINSSGAAGRFVPLNGSPATRLVRPTSMPSPEAQFAQNAAVGTNGSAFEQGLQAGFLALSNPLIFGHNAGFLRPDAVLSIIFVSDEEDQSPGNVDFFVNFFLSIKGFRNSNLFSGSAVVGDAPGGCSGSGGNAYNGSRYIDVANRTGGIFQSICTSDWSRALEDLSSTAFGFKSRFFLSNQPVESSLVVTLDGVIIPRTSPQGTVNWSYEYNTNSINFSPFATPEPGAQITVDYTAECLP